MKVSQLISVQQLVSCSSSDTLEDARHLSNQAPHPPSARDRNYSLIA